MLQGAQRLLLGLALEDLALELGPSLGVGIADLGDGDHVQGVVDLAAAPQGEPVHDPPTRGPLDWGRAVVRGIGIPAGEASDVSGIPDQHGGVNRADPVDVGNRGPRGLDGHADAPTRGLDLVIETTLPSRSSRTEFSSQRICWAGDSGFTLARSASASETYISLAIPPGESSAKRECSRQMARDHCRPRSLLRFESSRRTSP